MNDLLSRAPRAVAMTQAILLSLFPFPALARETAPIMPTACAAIYDQAVGLKYASTKKSLSDLSMTLARNQDIRLADVSVLDGPCTDEIYAFRMGQIVFRNGAVFHSRSGARFTHAPGAQGFINPEQSSSGNDPILDQAQFIMSYNVDVAGAGNAQRFLDVGVWKKGGDYLVAAFTRQENGSAMPVELARSTQPIKSVTFFPSPDSNSGRLGLVEQTDHGIALVSLDWDHSALSRTLDPAR
jgi:hypothetical protein